MEREQIEKLLNEKASAGDIEAKIALAIDKIKYQGKVAEGIVELENLADENEVACHNLLKFVKITKCKEKYPSTYEKCQKQANKNTEIGLIDFGVIYQIGLLNEKKDIKKAIEYFQKAIDIHKSGLACQSILAIYYHGEDVERNLEKAYEYAKLGASFHYADCEVAIAIMYANGEYLKQDFLMSNYWLEKAFDDGKKDIATYIGNQYLGIDDEEQAFEWFSKGSEFNIPECITMLGYLYENGTEITHNYQEAINCYEKAASLGDGNAYFLLGLDFFEGKIVTKNNFIAKQYLEKALQLGVQDAKTFLNRINNDSRTAQTIDASTNANAYLDGTTFTGWQKIKQDHRQKEQMKQEKNREILRVAAAASNSTGFIDAKSGFFLDSNGDEITVDADTGYIINMDTGNISFYDKDMQMVYDSDKKEYTHLDVQDGYIYNYTTGTTSITSGNNVV